MKKLTLRSATIIISSTIVHRAHAQDFLYLMPSKEIAETGEDFYFKAYQMDKQTFTLSDRSRTLYLQVRTLSDSVVWSEKYPLVSGRANGHIYIGTDCPQGEYFIKVIRNLRLHPTIPKPFVLSDLLIDKYKANRSIVNMFDTINECRLNNPHYIINNQFMQTYNSSRIKFDENAILLSNPKSSPTKTVTQKFPLPHLMSTASS